MAGLDVMRVTGVVFCGTTVACRFSNPVSSAGIVGLTRAKSLGKRLKNQRRDEHAKEWDRFSWFGFGRHLQAET
jgi:hypothetical protein